MLSLIPSRVRGRCGRPQSGSRKSVGRESMVPLGRGRLRRVGRLPIAALIALIIFTPSHARAVLHTGLALISPFNSWDFSDSSSVAFLDGDLGFGVTLLSHTDGRGGEVASQSLYFLTNYPALIAYAPGDSTYESLNEAPADTTLYSEGLPILTFVAYVVRTKEHHYAKMRVTSVGGGGGIRIEYTYQDNGSRILVAPTPVRAVSWGRVKLFYAGPRGTNK